MYNNPFGRSLSCYYYLYSAFRVQSRISRDCKCTVLASS